MVAGMCMAEVGALVATAETAAPALPAGVIMVALARAEVVEVVDALQPGIMAAGVEVEPGFLAKAQMVQVGRVVSAQQVQEAEDHAEPVEAAVAIIMLGRAGRTAAVAAERSSQVTVVVERVQAAQFA